MNVAIQLHRAARLYGDQPAAICEGETRSYAEMESRSNRLANALLETGLRPGDRVATWLENSVRCLEVDSALAKAGLVRVSINPRLAAPEARYILRDAEARALIHGASFDASIEAATEGVATLESRLRCAEGTPAASAPALDYEAFLAAGADGPPGQAIDPEHLYCLFYTSGTTGHPKGVMLSHRAILHVACNILMELGPIALGEKILLMQPLSHGAGFFALPQWIKGGCAILMRHFDPAEVLRLAQAHEVEVIKLIPTMLQRILRVPGAQALSLPKLRAILYGASPMPEEPLRRSIEVFGARKLVQIYGQSECPATLTVLPAEDHLADPPHPQRLGSAGRAWSTVQVRVVDESFADLPAGDVGEVIVRGPHMMSGYWKREDLTREVMHQGWLKTKDMGRIDEHGYVYLVGRRDEMIISGGFNIAPREVEEVLYQHAAVQEAAVIGEPDPEWGQAVVAYVCLRDNTEGVARDVFEFSRPQLGFKRPKRLYLMQELPKNAAGKIQKNALRPQLSQRCIA